MHDFEKEADKLSREVITHVNTFKDSNRREGAKMMAMKLLPLLGAALGAFSECESGSHDHNDELLDEAWKIVFSDSSADEHADDEHVGIPGANGSAGSEPVTHS